MTTANERVSNRPLSATDLSIILRRDFDRLLSNDGMLSSPHVAFGRVAYEITVKLHLDNPAYPLHDAKVTSRIASVTEIADNPPVAMIANAPPLIMPSETAVVHAVELSQEIISPNLARVQNNLPVTIERRGQDGHLIEEKVRYPASIAEGEGSPAITTDVSDRVEKEWKVAPKQKKAEAAK